MFFKTLTINTLNGDTFNLILTLYLSDASDNPSSAEVSAELDPAVLIASNIAAIFDLLPVDILEE